MGVAIPPTSTCLPAVALRPYICGYAGFRISGLPPGTIIGSPSRNIHLIISFGAPITVLRMPDRSRSPAAYQALVGGLQLGPALVRQDSEAYGMHVFLTAPGVRSILGVPSAELASLVVDLRDIWGSSIPGLIDRLECARTWPERFRILDEAFTKRLAPCAFAPEIDHAWRELTRSHGCARIQELARTIGWSRRHFSERFRSTLGISPKSAGRIFRFERASRLMKDHHALAEVAAACGYYDQAHMSHEWASLAGCSPQEWIAEQLPFVQDYELAGRDPWTSGVGA
ncbi:MAG TPA: helix-turn-helix domain-containing protein [Steroidobacteraceae bacterium]|nr:helix-turn-helix domain-containing protein [Steroidobacteraceae bacterium]